MDTNVNNTNDEIEIDLRQLFFVLLDKIWIIILSGIGCALLGLMISKFFLVPEYESTTQLYVINRQTEGKVSSADLSAGTQLTKDYKELVISRPVTEQVISDLDLDMTHGQLEEKITVETPQDSRILKIIVRDTDPYRAKSIADAMATVSVDTIATVMETEKANIIEQGDLPMSPVSPNVMRNTVIGGAIGAFLAILIILAVFLLDDTIKSEDDVEKHLGLSVLSVIPIQEDEKKKKGTRKKSASGNASKTARRG